MPYVPCSETQRSKVIVLDPTSVSQKSDLSSLWSKLPRDSDMLNVAQADCCCTNDSKLFQPSHDG